jgi:predicted PurR-regulated permease PerM
VVTIVAALLGAALLGILGALIAVPIAAGIQLLLTEVAFPHQDES